MPARVNYLAGDYLPDEDVLFEALEKLAPLAFAGFEAAKAGQFSNLHLNKEVCEALLDLDDLDAGLGLGLLLSAGSLLSSPADFLLDATSVGAKAGLKAAATAAVTAAWYGMKYPILGGVLGALGWCGPPAWLTALGAFGLVKTFDWAFGGVRARARRKRTCDAVRLACPLCVQVIEADGQVTTGEAGFLRDLVRKSPLTRDERAAIFECDAEGAIGKLAGASKSLRRDTMAHVLLAVFADTNYHESEGKTVNEIAERVGEDPKWIASEADRIAREIRSAEVSGEAVFRASSYIAHRDGSLDEEESEMLTATLLSRVRAEDKRRSLGEEARRSGTDIDLFTRKKVLKECRKELGPLSWIGARTRISDPDDAVIDEVLQQVCLFVLTIGESPVRRDALREVAHTLGVSEKDCDRQFEKTRSRLEKFEKKLNQAARGKCPACGTTGNFTLKHSRLVERDEFECRECGAVVLRCVWPKCPNMATTSDFWDHRFCPDCTDKLLRRGSQREGDDDSTEVTQ